MFDRCDIRRSDGTVMVLGDGLYGDQCAINAEASGIDAACALGVGGRLRRDLEPCATMP